MVGIGGEGSSGGVPSGLVDQPFKSPPRPVTARGEWSDPDGNIYGPHGNRIYQASSSAFRTIDSSAPTLTLKAPVGRGHEITAQVDLSKRKLQVQLEGDGGVVPDPNHPDAKTHIEKTYDDFWPPEYKKLLNHRNAWPDRPERMATTLGKQQAVLDNVKTLILDCRALDPSQQHTLLEEVKALATIPSGAFWRAFDILSARIKLNEAYDKYQQPLAKYDLSAERDTRLNVEKSILKIFSDIGFTASTFNAATTGNLLQEVQNTSLPSSEEDKTPKAVVAKTLLYSLSTTLPSALRRILAGDMVPPDSVDLAMGSAVASIPTIYEMVKASADPIKIRGEVPPDPTWTRLTFAKAAGEGAQALARLSWGQYKYGVSTEKLSKIAAEGGSERAESLKDMENRMLFAEIARRPRLGFELMAKYFYHNPKYTVGIFDELRSKGMGDYVQELNHISHQAEEMNADAKIKNNPANLAIVNAIHRMEIPEMMQLFTASLDEKTLKRYLDKNYVNTTADNEKLREDAIHTLVEKPYHPILNAIHVVLTPYEGVDNPVRESLVERCVHDLVESFPSVADGEEREAVIAGILGHAGEIHGKRSAKQDEAWAAFMLLSEELHRQPPNPSANEKVLGELKRLWKNKTSEGKYGLPMPEPIVKLLAGNLGETITAQVDESKLAEVLNTINLDPSEEKAVLDRVLSDHNLKRVYLESTGRLQKLSEDASPEYLTLAIDAEDVSQEKIEELRQEVRDLMVHPQDQGQLSNEARRLLGIYAREREGLLRPKISATRRDAPKINVAAPNEATDMLYSHLTNMIGRHMGSSPTEFSRPFDTTIAAFAQASKRFSRRTEVTEAIRSPRTITGSEGKMINNFAGEMCKDWALFEGSINYQSAVIKKGINSVASLFQTHTGEPATSDSSKMRELLDRTDVLACVKAMAIQELAGQLLRNFSPDEALSGGRVDPEVFSKIEENKYQWISRENMTALARMFNDITRDAKQIPQTVLERLRTVVTTEMSAPQPLLSATTT